LLFASFVIRLSMSQRKKEGRRKKGNLSKKGGKKKGREGKEEEKKPSFFLPTILKSYDHEANTTESPYRPNGGGKREKED